MRTRALLLLLVSVAVLLACAADTPTSSQTTTTVPQNPGAPAPILTTVDTLVFGNAVYPTYKFRRRAPDECDENHWHSSEPVVNIGRIIRGGESDGQFFCVFETALTKPDRDPGGCGHGKVSNVTQRATIMGQFCLNAYVNSYGGE